MGPFRIGLRRSQASENGNVVTLNSKLHESRSEHGLSALLRDLFRASPRRSATAIILLVASGLAEGVGILSLLPLLQISSDSQSGSGPAGAVSTSLESLGLRPSVGVLLLLVVTGITLKAGLFLLAMRQAGYAAADTAQKMRLQLLAALMNARWDYFTRQPVGTVTNTMSGEVIRSSSLYTHATHMLSGAIQVAVYFGLAIITSWLVTLAAATVGALLIFSLNFLIRIARREGNRETELLRSLTRRLADALSAIKPLKAMGRISGFYSVLDKETRALNVAQRRQILSSAVLVALQEPLVTLFLAGGIYLALTTFNVAFQELLFIALLLQRLVTRIGNVQTHYQSVSSLESAYWSVVDATKEAASYAERSTGRAHPTLNKSLVVRDLQFQYGEVAVLADVSFEAPAGKFTAILGPSGIGKTTLIDLIAGLYEPQQGEILLDSTPLSEIAQSEWRKNIGYVPQEMTILHDTIFTNVAMDTEGVGRKEAEIALRKANAWEFVEQLPQGMETLVGERGVRLSGGQRQRLAVARAIAHRPLLLLLDEPTTALDPRTEKAVLTDLRTLLGSMTIIAISHQTAIIQAADVVIDLGARTETATSRSSEGRPSG